MTLKASEAVFRVILSGDQNPFTAMMSGKLKVDGNQMRALKVSEVLTPRPISEPEVAHPQPKLARRHQKP